MCVLVHAGHLGKWIDSLRHALLIRYDTHDEIQSALPYEIQSVWLAGDFRDCVSGKLFIFGL